MIKFTLSDFYYFHTINDKFINLSRSHTNWLLDKNIVFSYIRGTFPYNIWNGGLNNMIGNTLLYPNIELIIKHSNLPLWLDFSNILLEKSDFYDVMSNVILKLLPDNYIFEISNLVHYKYRFEITYLKHSHLVIQMKPLPKAEKRDPTYLPDDYVSLLDRVKNLYKKVKGKFGKK